MMSVRVRGQKVTWHQPRGRPDVCLAPREDILNIDPITSSLLENNTDTRQVGANLDLHVLDLDFSFLVKRVIVVDINIHHSPLRRLLSRMFRGLVINTLRGRSAPGATFLRLSAVGDGDNSFCQIPLGSNYSLGNNVTLKLGPH